MMPVGSDIEEEQLRYINEGEFRNYFMQKIDVINKSMDSLVPREDAERSNVCNDNCACVGAIFSDFEALN